MLHRYSSLIFCTSPRQMEDPGTGRSFPGQNLWLTDIWSPTSASEHIPFLSEILDHCRQNKSWPSDAQQVPGRKYQMEVCRSRREKSGRYPADQNFCNSYADVSFLCSDIMVCTKSKMGSFHCEKEPSEISPRKLFHKTPLYFIAAHCLFPAHP